MSLTGRSQRSHHRFLGIAAIGGTPTSLPRLPADNTKMLQRIGMKMWIWATDWNGFPIIQVTAGNFENSVRHFDVSIIAILGV